MVRRSLFFCWCRSCFSKISSKFWQTTNVPRSRDRWRQHGFLSDCRYRCTVETTMGLIGSNYKLCTCGMELNRYLCHLQPGKMILRIGPIVKGFLDHPSQQTGRSIYSYLPHFCRFQFSLYCRHRRISGGRLHLFWDTLEEGHRPVESWAVSLNAKSVRRVNLAFFPAPAHLLTGLLPTMEHLLQGLGVVVVASVAFLAVAQQQLRQFHGETVDEPGSTASYHGLVGLSLTYALPIVGDDRLVLDISLFG